MAQKSSKKLSFIGSNIKKIRKVMHISQAEFAGTFNLARPSVGAYEEGRSEPKIETIISMASHFRISIDVLLTKNLTVKEIFNLDQLNKKLDSVHSPDQRATQKIEEDLRGKTPLVSVHEYLDYIVGYKNADFISQLEHITLPIAYDDSLRAFEMNGSEMEYHQQGLHHGDILIGKIVSVENIGEHTGDVFCVVHIDQIFTRRLVQVTDHTLIFESDDPNYYEVTVNQEEVLQLWSVKQVITEYLTKPSLLEERLMKLEKEVALMKRG